jgi:ankyrin repeat protein
MPTFTNRSASPEVENPFPANTIEHSIWEGTNNPEYMRLILAADDGDVEEVKKLVNEENVYNLFFHPQHGCKTALHCAAERGYSEVVKVLLTKGAIVDYPDGEKMTPLLRAAFSPNDNTLSIIKLLKEKGANHNAVDNLGNNALHIAINKSGGSELIKGLVDLEVNVDKCNNKGETPLHFAISKRSTELVKALLDGGADALLVDKDDKTYLHHLADFHKGQPDNIKDIMILLIQKGVVINAVDKEGRTALEIARENNNPNFAEALSDYKNSVEKVNAWFIKNNSKNSSTNEGHAPSGNHAGPQNSPRSAFSEPASREHTSSGSSKSG